jgi:hypothetical protein
MALPTKIADIYFDFRERAKKAGFSEEQIDILFDIYLISTNK